MESYSEPVTQNCTKIILEQMNNSIYKINKEENDFRTGIFCYIKYKNRNIPVLITNFDNINNIKNNVINVSINDINEKIELGNAKYFNKALDIVILEIKDNKKNKLNFIELDNGLFNSDAKKYYSDKSMYILLYNGNKEISVSYGLINYIKNSEIIYSSYKYINNKISPIFNLSNNKLIGIHKYISNYYNRGIFLRYLIDKFIEKYKKINEINLVINIKKDEINKKIYFLDNNNYNKNNLFSSHHNHLKELNEFNTELYINNKKYIYQKFFIPKKEGDHNIKLIFYINLTDCSFMFSGCYNIKNINLFSFISNNVVKMNSMFSECYGLENLDLSAFNTKNVMNMEYMFYCCKNLKDLNLSSFNTRNVINMEYMFFFCKNLKDLNLSIFNTEKVTDMSNIFHGCESLENINLSSFNTINVKNMNHMFYCCKNLKDLNLIYFNTSNVSDMNNMFNGCEDLRKINLSSFCTINVTNMDKLFFNCYNLKNINLLYFNTENVIDMNNMFYNCHSLEHLDLSSFDIKNVKYMNNIFYGCLDLINLKLCTSLDKNDSKNNNANLFKNNNLPYTQTKTEANNFKKFNIKFIGDADYIIKKIKNINCIESIDSIKALGNKLFLSKEKNEIIFNLIDEKEYLNYTYHKPDCIIFVFNFENQKNYDYMKLCANYYIKNYNLIYLFGIKLNKNNINKYIENDSKQFADSNNLNLIQINEDNEDFSKSLLNNLLIEFEKKENKDIINQKNINIIKEITPKIYKIVLSGDSGIGAKSSLIQRLIDDSFENAHLTTIGFYFRIKLINLKNGNKIKLQIFDTAGQERFRTINKIYYKSAHYIVIGYDVTDRNSFKNIKNVWFKEVLNSITDKSRLRYLIGNKIDKCDRRVSKEEGRALANELNLKFFEISCKDNIGIDEFYDDLINDILNNFENNLF